MYVAGINVNDFSNPGEQPKAKFGTVVTVVDNDGFTKSYQYASVTQGGVVLGNVCLMSSGGSARNLTVGRAATGLGDSTRVAVAAATIPNGGSGWFQVYGNCKIAVDGPTPAGTRLFATVVDGLVGNEVTASFIQNLVTTSSTGAAATVSGFINWASTVTSTGDGTQGPVGSQGPSGADGATGPAGSSAYQLAVANGFTGTLAEWLDSLVGPQGPAGSPGGLDAYEIAVANGFSGTEVEWLESLIGPQGPAGPPGSGGSGADPSSDRWMDDFGAIGDGASHPLSASYASLALAQVDFPYATSLTQEKDYCAFLTALYGATPGGNSNIVTVRMRRYKFYYFGESTIDPTRRVRLVGYGQSVNSITFKRFGPGGLGVPAIWVHNSSANESEFWDFTVTGDGSGARWTGGTIFEYNAAHNMLLMNDGVNGTSNKSFEARPYIAPRGDVIDVKFTTGSKNPYGLPKDIISIAGNPMAFTPNEQLTVIRGGVPTPFCTVFYCCLKINAILCTDVLTPGVVGETITGATSGATALYLQKSDQAGLHMLQVASVTSTGGIGLDAGNYLTDIYSRQIFCEEGTFAHGVEFNQVAYATRIKVQGFAGDGFKITAGSEGREGNANRSWLLRCVAVNNGGNGFHIAGSDGNVCTAIECNAISNGALGFNDRSFLGGTFQACHMSLNLVGGYHSVRNSSFIGCYVEGGYESYPHLRPENIIDGDAVTINGQTGVQMTMGDSGGLRLTGREITHGCIKGVAGTTVSLGYDGNDNYLTSEPSLRVYSGPMEFLKKRFSASDSGGAFAQDYEPAFRFNAASELWYRNGSGARLSASGGNNKFHGSFTVDGSGAITGAEVITEGSGYSPVSTVINIDNTGGSGAILKAMVGPKGGIIKIVVVAGGSGYTGSRDWKPVLQMHGTGIAVGAQWAGGESQITSIGPDANHNIRIIPKGTGRTVCVKPSVTNVDNYADDAAAAAGGVPVGGLYHTSGVLKVRLV